ncbi:MAG: (d)CMP kinase [Bacteroidales bacterium]
MKRKITIAIDGFSSCGKSTMAKDLAKELGYIYVDSGAMYRTVTLYAMENDLISNGIINTEKLEAEMDNIHITFKFNDITKKPDTYLNGTYVEDKIRQMEVSNNVSPIAALGFVRKALVKMQQAMGKEKGIVMDGRDIGTVVFPDAELKIFVTASPDVRAQRRFDELTAKGDTVNYNEILENVKKRDYIDQNREESPLKQADDAIVLDNSEITIEEQRRWLINKALEVINR